VIDLRPNFLCVGSRRNTAIWNLYGKTCYNGKMTKLLDEAIERVRQLPEALQDEAAEILLSLASKCTEPVCLDDATRTAVREGKAQASRGEFVPDEEMAEFFKRHRG
jgi:predicted transcriptional regulator